MMTWVHQDAARHSAFLVITARRASGEKAERRKLKRYGSGYYLAQFDCVVGKTLKSRQDTSSGLFG
jgi:hypothetical protein